MKILLTVIFSMLFAFTVYGGEKDISDVLEELNKRKGDSIQEMFGFKLGEKAPFDVKIKKVGKISTFEAKLEGKYKRFYERLHVLVQSKDNIIYGFNAYGIYKGEKICKRMLKAAFNTLPIDDKIKSEVGYVKAHQRDTTITLECIKKEKGKYYELNMLLVDFFEFWYHDK